MGGNVGSSVIGILFKTMWTRDIEDIEQCMQTRQDGITGNALKDQIPPCFSSEGSLHEELASVKLHHR